MKLQYLFVLLIVLTLTSCERILIKKDPPNTFVGNFETFWNGFDQHYSFFELKEVDWDAVYDQYRPRVDNAQSEDKLFSILAEMTLLFKDGHVNLYTPDSTIRYNFREGFSENSPEFARNYLADGGKDLNSTIHYGDIDGTNIGYMYIKSFDGSESHFKAINSIFPWIESKDAFIIDVRSNGGGSDVNSGEIVSKFASSKQMYSRVRYRNGPGRNDFTKWINQYVKPKGSTFTKPVAVLTNRSSFSTAETFVESIKVFDHVITVGGNTGGGAGNPLYRDLPNGWIFRLSQWQEESVLFGNFEGVGIPPDHPVDITEADIASETDAILEKAIEVLQ